MIWQLSPPSRNTPCSSIVCPDVASVSAPHSSLVNPAAEVFENEGADHPDGTAMSMSPLWSPPLGAAYVNVSVFPVELVIAVVGDTVIVPVPSGAVTSSVGAVVPSVVSVPDKLDFSCTI